MYDAYLPLVKRAGGVPKFVTLRPPHWRLDEDALKAAFSPKTKAVIFNNQLNPTATVFPRADLEQIGRASWRERVCQEVKISEVRVSLKKNTHTKSSHKTTIT